MILPDNQDTQRKTANVVRAGGVIGFRTDTFYGLGVDPFDQAAVQRIKELKGREDSKPILVLISEREQIARVIPKRSEAFESLAERFWPGPLTIIGIADKRLPVEITAGTGTVGVRLPDDQAVTELVSICGGVLTATSANPSGEPPAETAQQLAEYFPTGLDLIIDSGRVSASQPSTVVDATGDVVRVIREGLIKL